MDFNLPELLVLGHYNLRLCRKELQSGDKVLGISFGEGLFYHGLVKTVDGLDEASIFNPISRNTFWVSYDHEQDYWHGLYGLGILVHFTDLKMADFREINKVVVRNAKSLDLLKA